MLQNQCPVRLTGFDKFTVHLKYWDQDFLLDVYVILGQPSFKVPFFTSDSKQYLREFGF